MPQNPPTISFRLPDRKRVEVHLVKLADGRTVSRTREELLALPPELRVDLPAVPEAEVEE